MQFTSLPGLPRVSKLCMGLADYGTGVPRETAFELMDAFVAAGGNFFDTAHIYAAWIPNGWGVSERTLGAWLQARGNREKIVIATKGGHPPLSDMKKSRLSPTDVRQDLNESLERLGTDHVELYYLHRDDPDVPVAGIMDTLNECVSAGKVKALGASNWIGPRIAAANEYAQKKGLAGFVVAQPLWNLAQTNPRGYHAGETVFMNAELLAWHKKLRVPLIPYSAQTNGLFGKPIEKLKASGNYNNDVSVKRHQRVQELAARRQLSPNALALAWLLHQPDLCSAIFSGKRMEQLRDSISAVEIKLNAEELKFVEGA